MNGATEGGRLLALVEALAGRRVVIAGDLIADEFIYGEIARVSRSWMPTGSTYRQLISPPA